MSTIIDKRSTNKKRLAGSRARFIKRYREHIRDKIDQHIKDTNIKQIGDKVKVKIDKKSITEDRLRYDRHKSNHKGVYPGNKKYNKGDKEYFSDTSGKGSRASNSGMGEDDFTFILTKDEFMSMLFEDLELPAFVKKSFKDITKERRITGGYVKDGIPTRLSIKKTMEMAVARRMAGKGRDKKPRFIDDTDLRFRHYTIQQDPISSAVVFFVMDVSGSMSETHKLIAKKFFLLLHLFLTKNYKTVDVRFVSHTTDAEEVDEDEFFYSTKNGGTMISPAIDLVNSIINKEYDVEKTNIYIAQASDGDNWSNDYGNLETAIQYVLPKVQYFAYIEIDNSYPDEGVAAFYNEHFANEEKLNSIIIEDETEVIGALRALFKKE